MSSRCPVITDRSGIAVAALSTPPERCVPSYMERVVILTIVAPKRHLPWQHGLELDELVGPPDVVVGGGQGCQPSYPRGDLVGGTVRLHVGVVVSERSE